MNNRRLYSLKVKRVVFKQALGIRTCELSNTWKLSPRSSLRTCLLLYCIASASTVPARSYSNAFNAKNDTTREYRRKDMYHRRRRRASYHVRSYRNSKTITFCVSPSTMALLLVFLIDYRDPAAATDVSYLYNKLEKLVSFVYFLSPVRRTHILPA